jgi:SAM-dependent methyltransferase
MSNPWDERYSSEDYVYGESPNVFFADYLRKLQPGTLLLPCEGEGRNAVFAANHGWQVLAFDGSEVGRSKALQLAAKNNIIFEYQIADATTVKYAQGSLDVVAFIYAHFPPSIRQTIHKNAVVWLKLGGKIILEAFNPLQLNNSSGGPKDSAMPYTVAMLEEDFAGLHFELLETLETTLAEGKYHEGKADVIRMVGVKE